MANPNKVKGSTLERKIVNDLKDQYPFAKTARLASTLLDNCKVDISGVPFAIQAKAGYNDQRLRFDRLYYEFKTLIEQNFPPSHPIHKVPYILINKLNRNIPGKLKQPEMFQVTITYDFFLDLIKNYHSPHAEI